MKRLRLILLMTFIAIISRSISTVPIWATMPLLPPDRHGSSHEAEKYHRTRLATPTPGVFGFFASTSIAICWR